MPLTYTSYLKIDELLQLQQSVSDGPEHDETLFIVIHQAYELWFRQMLHELDHLMAAAVCERMVDLDEGMQEWRCRHVKMVQRTIGTKRGTGGSEGAAYLMTTLNKPVFPDLRAIRSAL